MNMVGSSLLDEDRGSTGQEGNTDNDLSDRDVLAPYLVRTNSIDYYKQQLFTDNHTIASVTLMFSIICMYMCIFFIKKCVKINRIYQTM